MPGNPELAQLMLLYSRPYVGQLRAHELASMLWSLGKLQVQPAGSWLEAVWAASEPQLGSWRTGELAMALYGLGLMQVGAGWQGGGGPVRSAARSPPHRRLPAAADVAEHSSQQACSGATVGAAAW